MNFSRQIKRNLLVAHRHYQLLFLIALLPIGGLTVYMINRSFARYMRQSTQLYVFHREGASIQVNALPMLLSRPKNRVDVCLPVVLNTSVPAALPRDLSGPAH